MRGPFVIGCAVAVLGFDIGGCGGDVSSRAPGGSVHEGGAHAEDAGAGGDPSRGEEDESGGTQSAGLGGEGVATADAGAGAASGGVPSSAGEGATALEPVGGNPPEASEGGAAGSEARVSSGGESTGGAPNANGGAPSSGGSSGALRCGDAGVLSITGTYLEPNGDEVWIVGASRASTLARVPAGTPSALTPPALYRVERVCSREPAAVLEREDATFTRLDWTTQGAFLFLCIAAGSVDSAAGALELSSASSVDPESSGCNSGPWLRLSVGAQP